MASPSKPTEVRYIDLDEARQVLAARPDPKSAIRVSRDWLDRVIRELADCRARKAVRP